MIGSTLTALVGALIFGTSALCGVLIATVLLPRLRRHDDGPEPVKLHPAYLIGGAAVLGALLGWRRLPNPEFAIAALTMLPLAGAWYCDALTGLIPDVFTLVPLAVAVGYETFVMKQPWVVLAALVLFLPFALGAVFSKGRGMGWGDAKLAAFGGALLGMRDATLAFGIASLALVVVGSIRYRSRRVPLAFAPYLVAAIAATIAVRAL